METNLIITQINSFIELTKNRKIDWSVQQNNPAIIKWDRIIGDKSYAVTIQKQQLPFVQQPGRPGVILQSEPTFFYFFTIAKMSPPPAEVILQINSQIESQYKDPMNNLYNVALDYTKQAAADLLGNLLRDL